MKKQSAGFLVYRIRDNKAEVLLEHPGGPFWAKKDEHAWSIPKGEVEGDEDLLKAARREFQEETGWPPPDGKTYELGEAETVKGKISHIWAVKGNYDESTLKSQVIEIEWPPRSGRKREFPEVDRAAWFSLPAAATKLYKGQVTFLDRLRVVLDQEHPSLEWPEVEGYEKPAQASLF